MEDNVLSSDFEMDEANDETLPEYFLRRAKEHAESGHLFWIMDALTEETHNFENFEIETRKIASFLYKRGMRKGDTAIYMTVDMVHNYVFFNGVWRANGVVRASYPEDDEATLLSRVEESRVGWIYCDPETAEMCKDVATKVSWDVDIIVKGEVEGCISINELLNDDGFECPEFSITFEDTAMILCTSGTTGRSKGAVHTHKSFLNMFIFSKKIPLCDEEANLFVTKGTHISGVLFPLICLAEGKLAIVMPIVTKENLFVTVDKYKPGFVCGFPTFLLLLVYGGGADDYDFSSIKIIASGGTQITPAMRSTIGQLPNVEAFVNLYGLTETNPVISDIDMEQGRRMDDVPAFSVGKVYPGALLTVRDIETGSLLGSFERGELCVKSARNFSHYLNNREATENAFIDGYFKTGDMGYFDEQGFIFIVDRMKEIFKYYNNHISPTELEDVINEHDAVKEVCVIGVEDPEGGGCIPRAVITVRLEEVTAQEIEDFANERLPDYKKIRGGVFIVEELPRGKTGKITRNLVAEMELDG